MYSLLLLLIYLAFISLGLPDSLLGASWPIMSQTLQVPLSYMGLVTMVISGGTIVSSLFSDKLTRRFGTGRITVSSVCLTALALLGFSYANHFALLLLFAIPYGLGAGAIDAALNNYVALHYSSKHMSWLHCFWGVGTIVSPFVMSYALTNATWHLGYKLVAFLQIAIALILWISLPLWRVNEAKTEKKAKSLQLSLRQVLKIKGVPFLLFGFFAYCAAEATTMHWASTYLVEVKSVSAQQAAAFASLFFIGLTIGRFLAGFLMDRLGNRKMILLGASFFLVGISCLLLPLRDENMALAGFIIIGLGCAPIYPCIIHATPSLFGSEYSGAIIGIQMASAYIGSAFVPPLFGVLGKWLGFGILPLYLLVFVLIMGYMIEKTFHITRPKETNETAT